MKTTLEKLAFCRGADTGRAFCLAVETTLADYDHVSTGACEGCDESDCSDETYFSWGRCCCCDSRLGGDRNDCHGIDRETGELCHIGGACVDCVCFLANGDIPENWEG